MKILRFIVILVLILGAAFLAICAFSPKEVTMERSTVIDAPKSVVWPQIQYFKNWPNWSPWKEMDSAMKVTVTDNDGQKGSSYHWVGDPKRTGEGEMENTGITDNEMKFNVHFVKPFEASSDGWLKMADEAGKVKVTWGYHAKYGFIASGIMTVMGMGKELAKSFDRGLELMKKYCEAHKNDAAASAYKIEEIQFPAHIYAGIRKVVKWADMNKFFGESYGLVGKAAGARIAGPAVGLYYTWDDKNMETDAVAGFPVSDNKPVAGASIIEVPASSAYKMVYVGPYSGFMQAHNAMHEHITASGKTQTLVVEEYITDPMTEKDSTKYITNIIYLYK